MRIAIAQLNLLVGDVAGNTGRVIAAAARARDELAARLVVFPELTLTSYPPEDLLLDAGLRVQVEAARRRLLSDIHGIGVLVGFPEWDGDALYNSAALVDDGAERAVYRKQLLPNYAVFDEKRYFTPAYDDCVVEFGGVRLGVTICEDLWFPEPGIGAAGAGAELLLNLSASPFQVGRQAFREREVFGARAREAGVPVVCVNLVGGQDEFLFDGGSLVTDAAGGLAVRAPAFEEALLAVDFERDDDGRVAPVPGVMHTEEGIEESIWHALMLGTRDYVEKNAFPGVVLGLSGGIDSAVCAVAAADALGAHRVHTVMMPSPYTARQSRIDAAELARRLGVDHREIDIEPSFVALLDALAPTFAGMPADLAEQNLQARCRGTLLMALSNKLGWLVLLTGNKSEFAVGYTTLYGDMAGGFAPLKDVSKTMVYRLARWRNAREEAIPAGIIERAPSAELAHGQVDQDTLPPYDQLDAIIHDYIDRNCSFAELLESGHDPDTARRVVAMIRATEYKRRQAAPGVRVTGRAFGRDRRYPITSGYKD